MTEHESHLMDMSGKESLIELGCKDWGEALECEEDGRTYEFIIGRNDFLRHECDELCELIADMHALLQRVCDATDIRDCWENKCIMLSNPHDDCDFRKIEERMRELGIEAKACTTI